MEKAILLFSCTDFVNIHPHVNMVKWSWIRNQTLAVLRFETNTCKELNNKTSYKEILDFPRIRGFSTLYPMMFIDNISFFISRSLWYIFCNKNVSSRSITVRKMSTFTKSGGFKRIFFLTDYKVTIGICSCTITSLLFSF